MLKHHLQSELEEGLEPPHHLKVTNRRTIPGRRHTVSIRDASFPLQICSIDSLLTILIRNSRHKKALISLLKDVQRNKAQFSSHDKSDGEENTAKLYVKITQRLACGQAILFVRVQKELHVCQQGQRGDVTALRALQVVGKRCGVSTNQDAQARKTLTERRKEASARLAQKRRRALCGKHHMATDTQQTWCSYFGICRSKYSYLVPSYPCSVSVRGRLS